MKIMTMTDVSGRDLDFVQNVCVGLAPTRAATEAGYSVGHAAALLQKPAIRAALEEIQKNVGDILERTKQVRGGKATVAKS